MSTNKEVFAEDILNNCIAFVSKDDGKIGDCREHLCAECLFSHSSECRKLFKHWLQQEYDPTNFVDWSKVEVDTPVFVKDDISQAWVPRHFCKYENGHLYAFDNGKTSFTSGNSSYFYWKYMKLAGPLEKGENNE